MSKKKKVIIGGSVGIVVLGLVFGGIKAYEYHQAKELVASYVDITFPNITVNEKDVAEISKSDLEQMLNEETEGFQSRVIDLKIDEQVFSTTLQDLGCVVSEDVNELAEEIFTLGKELDILDQAKRINEAPLVEYSIEYTYDESLVDEWVDGIANQLYVQKVEPTFKMVSTGNFEVTDGQVGYSIDAESIKEQIKTALNEISNERVEVSSEGIIEQQNKDPELLKSVNARISSYSSTFPVGIPRATNVELATAKVNQTLLMPGEEFSYTEKVSPVVYSNGYVDATVFVNAQPVNGVGGGICQVSSTMYNTLLLAGIMPTERRNHSLTVDYVPRGLDATMAEDAIDFRFVNTLDYPIYINAYTSNGILTVEFWSNENALNGITYQPQVTQIDSKKYQTYLLGYDITGSLVYNEYVDTSTYK